MLALGGSFSQYSPGSALAPESQIGLYCGTDLSFANYQIAEIAFIRSAKKLRQALSLFY